MSVQDEILQSSNQVVMAVYGLRLVQTATGRVKLGSVLPASRQWDDGRPTKRKLEGTSAVALAEDADVVPKDVARAMKTLVGEGYQGKTLLLVGGYRWQRGEDTGEIVIKEARVLGKWPWPLTQQNPSRTRKDPVKVARDKAKAWYRRDDLLTEPQLMDWDPPESMVDVGKIVAIEYESDKFDGTKRIYRHDVTHVRRLLISPDGGTLVIVPPFKLTTRGIEG